MLYSMLSCDFVDHGDEDEELLTQLYDQSTQGIHGSVLEFRGNV